MNSNEIGLASNDSEMLTIDSENGEQITSSTPVKNKVIKNLTEAHGWLGVIISAVLFLVFWAGSVTLFYEEIRQWAAVPHYPVNVNAPDMPLQQIVEQKLAKYDFDAKEHLSVFMPTEHYPYYRMNIDLVREKGKEDQHGEVVNLIINPKTGETVSDNNPFTMASFIYRLHFNLNLPGGGYIVGVITLFFFFALISGVFIHAKKMFKNFFQYRTNKRKRDKLLDMHNVVGVMSLPFTIMFAISGLIFNLAIIYQISFAVFLYKGDQSALLKDAGYDFFTEKTVDIKQDMTKAFDLIVQSRNDENQTLNRATFYNYGDQNAAIELRGSDHDNFAQRNEVFYRVSDGSVISKMDIEQYNTLRKGLDVIATLHFGNFAGIDLRILYFILGIAVCAMIIVGNILWLDKRILQRNVSKRSIGFVRSLTVGLCSGFVVATAVVFLAERILPLSLIDRGTWVVYTYVAVLSLVAISAFWVINNKRFIARLLQVTVALVLLIICADWWLFGASLITLWQDGFRGVIGVEIGLLLFAVASLWIAKLLLKQPVNEQNRQITAVQPMLMNV